VIYVKQNFSDNPKMAKKILSKLMLSLKSCQNLGVPEMGEILLVDDIPLG
jgi:hypothetical protein